MQAYHTTRHRSDWKKNTGEKMSGNGLQIHKEKNKKNRTMRGVFTSPLEKLTAQSGSGTGFSSNTSVFFCQYYSINLP
jgi:hypothetical protein